VALFYSRLVFVIGINSGREICKDFPGKFFRGETVKCYALKRAKR